MAKSMTNVWTYVLIVFIAVFFISALKTIVHQLITNSNFELSDNELDYTNSIGNMDFSNYTKNASQIESDELNARGNDTGSQLKDNAVEFFFSNTIAGKVTSIIKTIFTVPGIFMRLLGADEGNWGIFINIINWLWSIGILLAGYYLIRGINS